MIVAYLIPYGREHEEITFLNEFVSQLNGYSAKLIQDPVVCISLLCNGILASCLKNSRDSQSSKRKISTCPYCYREQSALVTNNATSKYNIGQFVSETPKIFEATLFSESELRSQIYDLCGDDINYYYTYLALRRALVSLKARAILLPRSSQPFLQLSLLAVKELRISAIAIDDINAPYLSLEIINSELNSLRIFSCKIDTDPEILKQVIRDKLPLIIEQLES